MKNKVVGFMLLAALALGTYALAAETPATTEGQVAAPASTQAPAEKTYVSVTQGDLSSGRESYDGKNVQVGGQFLFTGSDFCYQIRKTKINTRDYLCFALGPVSLIRFYLKKDHPQVDELLKVKKGMTVKAYGAFDSIGNDYKYVVVDKIEVLTK